MENSFVLYTSYKEILQDLTVEEMGYIFKAILEYKTTGQIISLPKTLLITFRFIKNQLDLDNEKYNKIKEARSRAGKIHKGNQYTQKSNGTRPNNKKQNGTKWNKVEQMEHNDNDNVNDNDNDNVNIKKESIKKKETVALTKATPTPQAEVFEYFAKLYKQETNIDYLGKAIDYINLAKLIKKYGKALVIQKINWLLVGCKNSVFFFSKDMTDFNVSTLITQWDRILPKLTDEQRKEEAKRKKAEETKAKVMAELAKQGVKLEEGGNDVSRV